MGGGGVNTFVTHLNIFGPEGGVNKISHILFEQLASHGISFKKNHSCMTLFEFPSCICNFVSLHLL